MIRALIIGALAAVVVFLPAQLRAWLVETYPDTRWLSPLHLLAAGLIAAALQRWVIERRPGSPWYDGVPDLHLHIHSPSTPDSSLRWAVRGLISMLFAFFGGVAGAEGAAIEFSQAALLRARPRVARWFEQRRRTDAACAVAAGVSAAFGAPFAALLLPAELGMGGRLIPVGLASLSAFLCARQLTGPHSLLPVRVFDASGALAGFETLGWRAWLGILGLGISAGLAGGAYVRFQRWFQANVQILSREYASARILAGSILLCLAAALVPVLYGQPQELVESVILGRHTLFATGLLGFALALTLALLLSCIGTAGLFWPVFALGVLGGYAFEQIFFQEGQPLSSASALLGAAGLFGALLGAPLAGAVLVFECARSLPILLPALVVAYAARITAGRVKGGTLIERNLAARGLRLIAGRAGPVLESLLVREAMVTDFESLQEHQAVSEIHARLVQSPYPFFPVVREGRFSGMLTLDIIQDAWHSDATVTSHSSLSKLLEVKDLLYRAGFKTPVLKVDQALATVSPLLEENPCLPVIDETGKVVGLLFVHSVRLAYDREMARRSLGR